jgi:hypothetical protein
MLRHQRFELSDQVSMTTERKLGLDPLLHHRKPQLLEASDLRLRERLVGDVGEG